MRRAIKRKVKKKYLKYRPYSRSVFFNRILDAIFNIFHPEDDKEFAKHHFHERMGYELNYDNPQTYNEKIQWLKIYDRTKLHTICADKFLVRDYVAKKIGDKYLIPLLFKTKDVEEIIPENIPDCPCIIKTNHDSGTYIFIKDKKNQDWNVIQKRLKKAMAFNYYFNLREWQYKNIEPLVIVEKLLVQEDGSIPCDYKFHCANGKLLFIQVDSDRVTNHSRNLYDSDWNLLPIQFYEKNGSIDNRPHNLKDMIKLAETLSKAFSFARIDFYEVNKKVYFGEITFHPAAGFEKFTPNKWDLIFGKKITLPLNQ